MFNKLVGSERAASQAPRSRAQVTSVSWPSTELRDLPPEQDPFESDWPWPGWTEATKTRSSSAPRRSATFERDMRRVLDMFAH